MDPETMKPVPNDGKTMGEIMIRGNIVMKGYLKIKKQPINQWQVDGFIQEI